jgi:hypothetical protein
MRIVAIPLILAALSGCAMTPQQREQAAAAQAKQADSLDKALAGLTPVRTMSCIPITSGTISTKAYGPTILYTVGRGLIYRTDTAGGCEGMMRGDALVTVQLQGRPCSGDIARTVDTVARFPTGSCALGEFTEYRKR